ncbi:MAG TPA: DUF5996 family protein [Balneolales bacterium]|nr:DUF5996 family protein [Balneolales bacterium]
MDSQHNLWPGLPFEEWQDTYATLHLWTQIVGKIRLTLTPWTNHSWHVPLYVTSRGLTTTLIPYGSRGFQVDFDFIDHKLRIETCEAFKWSMDLKPQTVSYFYTSVMNALAAMGMPVTINKKPNEIVDPIPFDKDEVHSSYDPECVHQFWRILVHSDRIFKQFRTRFIGKCSPVHFFWGSFDLAVTRFSGRKAPLHPGGVPNIPDWVVQEAYSHEVYSCGFWPGGGALPFPVYYAYAYPEPPDFREANVRLLNAFYSEDLSEFILPYEDIRTSDTPDNDLIAFLQKTYEAAADLGQWDRNSLEQVTA